MIYSKGDIGIYRKIVSISPTGKQLGSCEWRRTLLFNCVQTQLVSDDLRSNPEMEVNVEKRLFILDSYQQKEQMPYVIKKTDYLGFQVPDEPDFIYWHKIVNLELHDIRKGCCRLYITTERIEPRECEKIGLKCNLSITAPLFM